MNQILVIDDDDAISEMLCRALKKAGYSVLSAPNGKIGLEMQRQNRFELIITDIYMPEKDGLETISELVKSFPETKVIVISGGSLMIPASFLSIATELGAHKAISKPFEIRDLIAAVRELLSPDPASHGSSPSTPPE